MDGILGLALSPYVPGRERTLYYHAMSSGTENYVSTAYLRNRTLFEHDPAAAPYIFTVSALFCDNFVGKVVFFLYLLYLFSD